MWLDWVLLPFEFNMILFFFPPGEPVDEVNQVFSELVSVRADLLASFSSCAVE